MKQEFRAFSRRTALVGGLAAAAGMAGASVARADSVPLPVSLVRYARRADESYAALQRYFYDPQTSFYLEEYPREGGNPWSYVWPFSQAMIATQTMAGIRAGGPRYLEDVADRYTALEAYWNAGTNPPGYDSYLRPPAGHGGDKFYDDNEWNALGFLQRHYMTEDGDRPALERAAEIFDLVVYGWDTNPNHPCPGGVFWTQATWSNDRNTVSNAPGAEVGLHLYLATKKPYYLDWSIRMYEWVRSYMLAPNGLYWDHVDLAGNIQKTQWSYNQGTMIGAGVLLYRATGERKYLDQARDTATKALAFYAQNERYFNQPARFHAIFFANLLQLQAIQPDPAYRQAMEWYADEARRRFHDAATGLYRFTGTRPVTLLEQSGMIRIEAMLAWDPRNYGKLT
ncbi:glycoside hydrolase family 76 protein [Actinopolymorpha alba]|uniref:glycoside hydrolase family 76 protein n=1 Tax=Actinopolymorpha alba TaxID=533267 RepID=UPI000367A61D|nr:glycoside hydrolase family 76 protein [Actinopolymorpha alba]